VKLHLSWPVLVAIALAVVASWTVEVDDCDAASLWESVSVGIGGQGVWVDEGGAPAFRDAEAIGRASLGVTPHVNLVGGVSYGVDKSYLRGSGGVRITATDVNDPNFSIGVGVSRHYVSEPDAGLDEAAAEAAIGWKPFTSSRVILTGLAVYGIDTGRRMFSAGVVWPFKVVGGGQ
jgi:hypothetical protein